MHEKMKKMEDEKLLEIVGEYRDDYTPEALAAATQELELRGYSIGMNKELDSSSIKSLIREEMQPTLGKDLKPEDKNYTNNAPNSSVVEEIIQSSDVAYTENMYIGSLTLKEAILRTSYSKIEKTLKQDFCSEYDKYDFNQIYLVLLKINQVIGNAVELRIEKTFIESIDAYSDEEIIAYDSASDENFNPELSSWPEWLGYYVTEETIANYSITKFVSMCLIRIAQNEEEMRAYEEIEGKQLLLELEEEEDTENLPRPFVRYFARKLDYMLFGSSLGMLFCIFPITLLPSFGFTKLLSGVLISWLLVETICIYLWGCTPGKFIFSVQIVSANESPLSIVKALKRSVGVSTIGMGLGNAIASFVLNIFGYFKLTNSNTTLWDQYAGTEVRHSQLNMKRIIIGVSIVIIVTLINVGISARALANVI